jgi:hypothetical protein
MTIQGVFWVVTLCSDMVSYQHFRGPYCLHLQVEDGDSNLLQNVGILPHHYMVSQPGRPHVESPLVWKPKALQWVHKSETNPSSTSKATPFTPEDT